MINISSKSRQVKSVDCRIKFCIETSSENNVINCCRYGSFDEKNFTN